MLSRRLGGETRRAGKERRIPRGLIASGAVIAAFVLAALLGPVFVHYEHFHVNLIDRLRPPGSIADGRISLLGTDQVGRDLAGQILYGSRVSLFVGAATILIAGVFGSALGMLAGYSGTWLDTLIMRIADIQLALPPLVLAILIAGVIGPSVINVVVTLAITRWVLFARVARGSTLSYSTREFVDSARVLGASNRRILLRHILPSIRTPLLVLASVQFGLVILSEASLSFLGLGVPPSVPSWGQTIAGGQDYLGTAWWIATEPGIALAAIAVATAVFGAQVRDYFDPHLRALL